MKTNNFKMSLREVIPSSINSNFHNSNETNLLSKLGLFPLPENVQASISNDEKYLNLKLKDSPTEKHLLFQFPLEDHDLSALNARPDYQELINRYHLYINDYVDEIKQYLTNGATLTVYAMPISYSTKTVDGAKVPGYFNFIVTNVEVSDEMVANAELNKLTVPAEATEDFELPTLEGLVWSLKEDSAVITLNGNAVTLTFPETDTTVVLVATYTYKGVAYTKEFSVFVKGTVIEKPELKTEYETTSFADIKALVPADGNSTTDKYYVIGFVKTITNATYGNIDY